MVRVCGDEGVCGKCESMNILLIGKVIEVEEGEILSFHFANYTPQSQFVYVLCLEETGEWAGGGASSCIDYTHFAGNVKLVLMDLSERMLDKVSILKKLIQTYIPKGEQPATHPTCAW